MHQDITIAWLHAQPFAFVIQFTLNTGKVAIGKFSRGYLQEWFPRGVENAKPVWSGSKGTLAWIFTDHISLYLSKKGPFSIKNARRDAPHIFFRGHKVSEKEKGIRGAGISQDKPWSKHIIDQVVMVCADKAFPLRVHGVNPSLD